ncbi:MAG: hypothetical protein QM736_03600 [Vicinamibacterales bacterium]
MSRRLRFNGWLAAVLPLLAMFSIAAPAHAQAPQRVLGRDEYLLYGIGLKVEPATQTVPKDIATIVSTFLQAPTNPSGLPPFADDAEVLATLRGPSFQTPVELHVKPNTPFNIPPLTVPGTHVLEKRTAGQRGEVLLRGTPDHATIEVIEKLLVTQVTARALTAAEIREKGIVFDKNNYQAYNFSAAFAVADQPINLNFPVRTSSPRRSRGHGHGRYDAAGDPGSHAADAADDHPGHAEDPDQDSESHGCRVHAEGAAAPGASARRAADTGRGRDPGRHRLPQPVLQRDADGRQRRASGVEPRGDRPEGDHRAAARQRQRGRQRRRSAAHGADHQW